MSNSSSPYGYALRRADACASEETDCGPTWGGYHACCPGATVCPHGSPTSICCPDETDCTHSILGNPHCGDDTALLYFANNYFCCANGTTAYENEQGYVGCTTDVNAVLSNSDLTTLKSISTASQTTTASSSSSTAPATTTTSATSFSTTTSSSPTASSTSEPASSRGDSSSSTNTGAIAGGVVGGVAGAALLLVLAWFLYRHRNKKNYDSPENTPALAPVRQVGGTGELEGSEVTNPSELANYGWYGHKDPVPPTELPAHSEPPANS